MSQASGSNVLVVGLALERLEKGLKDHLSAVAGNGHADLLANGLLGASEDEVVGEGLQTCTLAIGKDLLNNN